MVSGKLREFLWQRWQGVAEVMALKILFHLRIVLCEIAKPSGEKGRTEMEIEI